MGKHEMTRVGLEEAMAGSEFVRTTHWITERGRTHVQALFRDAKMPGGVRPRTITIVGPENATRGAQA